MLEISPQLLKEAKLSVNDMATYLTQHGWKKCQVKISGQ
jgi:hypothetical protein